MEYSLSERDIEALLADLLEIYGYDFTSYSRASLIRRINRVFTLDKHPSFAEFRYQVRTSEPYMRHLVQEITVNVTEMFRDPDFYKTLREKVLPVLATYPLIRIWHAGCSTGEEVFSMAILLKEANLLNRSLLYATDLSPAVLEKASKGIFPMSSMRQYSENYIRSNGTADFSSYYTAHYGHAKFDSSLLERMIFSTHNLVSDHSFNEFQLIVCRNVLIYFDRELQQRVLDLFDESLDHLGFLALGFRESIRFSGINERLKPISLKEKIWRKFG